MAGSLRYFNYVDDADNQWAVLRDEGNTEAVNATGTTAAPAADTPVLSRAIEPRTVRYNSSDGLTSMQAILLANTAAAINTLPGTVTVNRQGTNVILYLTSYIGERQRFVPIIDTQQQDGDAETNAAG